MEITDDVDLWRLTYPDSPRARTSEVPINNRLEHKNTAIKESFTKFYIHLR